jgi:type IV secretory pathway TrbF-like protein
MRAIVTHRVIDATAETSAVELDLNPARVFVSDFSWTEIK